MLHEGIIVSHPITALKLIAEVVKIIHTKRCNKYMDPLG